MRFFGNVLVRVRDWSDGVLKVLKSFGEWSSNVPLLRL